MSDRIFGLASAMLALAYIASATQIQTSFLADPLGPRVFPYMIGGVAFIASIAILAKPDEEPEWPKLSALFKLVIAVGALVLYALTLVPLGYLLPTAVAAAVLSYLVRPDIKFSVLAGCGIAFVLFTVFRFGLGLSLYPLPKL